MPISSSTGSQSSGTPARSPEAGSPSRSTSARAIRRRGRPIAHDPRQRRVPKCRNIEAKPKSASVGRSPSKWSRGQHPFEKCEIAGIDAFDMCPCCRRDAVAPHISQVAVGRSPSAGRRRRFQIVHHLRSDAVAHQPRIGLESSSDNEAGRHMHSSA